MEGERVEFVRRHLLGFTNMLGAIAVTSLISIGAYDTQPDVVDIDIVPLPSESVEGHTADE